MRSADGGEGERDIIGGASVRDEVSAVEATHAVCKEINAAPTSALLQMLVEAGRAGGDVAGAGRSQQGEGTTN